jgi:hypothetical protein
MVKSTGKFNNNTRWILLSGVAIAQIVLLITLATSSYTYALTVLNTWGSRGSGNGQFDSPSGLDLDFKGNV